MRICVVGLGYVGSVTAICLARDGHEVLGIDADESKLALILSGKSPVVENGVHELTKKVVDAGGLTVTDEVTEKIAQYDIVFVCVGTPSASNGRQDLSAIQRVTEQIGSAMVAADSFPVVVYRSTLEPGTTEKVIRPALETASGRTVGRDFGLCFQPEFLREGSSIKDFDSPPLTVVGGDSARSIERVRELFDHLDAEFVATDISAAELLKLACNAFHALKVSFANEIGRLGQPLGVDARTVMEMLCKDRVLNVSPAYLRPGFAFGGSCLPKDLRSLTCIARHMDVDVPMLQSLWQSNGVHIDHAAELVMNQGSRVVGLVGLSFKKGTDDLRESPLVSLAELLIGKGYELKVYDPAVKYAHLIGSNKRFIEATIPHIASLITEDLDDVCDHADVLVVGHAGPEIEQAASRHLEAGKPVVDLVGLPLSKRLVKQHEDRYVGVCW